MNNKKLSNLQESTSDELSMIIQMQLDLMARQISLLGSSASLSADSMTNQEQTKESLSRVPDKNNKQGFDPTVAPVIGAKIGRDEFGNPAWFLENPSKAGEYFLLEV